MHSPEVVAFEIRRPWPHRHKHVLTVKRPRWRWSLPFVTVAGREFYFPPLITVWHNEPGGHDALTVCGKSRWQWHIRHWSLQIHPFQNWRRRLLTKCEWCGGRSRKRDCVNHALGWDTPKSPWWRGERGLYHYDCTSVELAHRTCLCDKPKLDHSNYGQCAACGKFRGWRQVPTVPDRYLASLPAGSRIPPGKREWLKAEWAKVRAEREAAAHD